MHVWYPYSSTNQLAQRRYLLQQDRPSPPILLLLQLAPELIREPRPQRRLQFIALRRPFAQHNNHKCAVITRHSQSVILPHDLDELFRKLRWRKQRRPNDRFRVVREGAALEERFVHARGVWEGDDVWVGGVGRGVGFCEEFEERF